MSLASVRRVTHSLTNPCNVASADIAAGDSASELSMICSDGHTECQRLKVLMLAAFAWLHFSIFSLLLLSHPPPILFIAAICSSTADSCSSMLFRRALASTNRFYQNSFSDKRFMGKANLKPDCYLEFYLICCLMLLHAPLYLAT